MLADVEALLEDADDQLVVVEQLYHWALAAKEQGRRLRPRIKNVLDNQRAALDFLAHNVYETHGDKSKKTKSYYPIAKSENDFPQWFDKNLPGVRSNSPAVADAIRRHQSWQPGHEWLGWLAGLSVENKHRILSPLTRDTGVMATYHLPDGSAVEVVQADSWPGDRLPIAEMFRVNGVSASGTDEWEEWLFAEPELPALRVLGLIQIGVKDTVADVRQVAGL